MKNFAFGFVVALVSLTAHAQSLAASAAQAERARIASERAQLERGFAAENSACYSRFAVNSCLGDVNARRRQAMADLRRQELLLNDQERRNRGADEIRKIDEKSSPEKQQEAADRRAKAVQDYQVRIEREKGKDQDRAAAQAHEKATAQSSAGKLKANQEKAQDRATKATAAAEESRKFEAKKKQAQERRAQHESDRLKQAGKAPAKSLPLPE